MKKPTQYILSFLTILLVIFACTKQVGLFTEVEFELIETNETDGYINTALATVITVVPEEFVDGYSYSYSYKINSGEGYFEDELGNIISEEEKIALDPLTASLNYIATEIGDHSIVFTAEDSFGFTEQVIATYLITDIPVTSDSVTWTATESTGQLLIGDTETITIVLGSETEAEEVTYERNYSFTEGTTGTLTTSEGDNETLNELVEITPGTYVLDFTATEIGTITIQFLLEDSNGEEFIELVSFEAFDIPGTISSEKEITSFSINDVLGAITDTTIDIELSEGTDLTTLSPTIVHTGETISPTSGVAQDFTDPVVYTVTAEDNTTQEYTVTVRSPALGTTNNITQFTIDGVDGTITGTDIALTLPAGTDVSVLTPTIVHTGETINPTSGVAQDFTNPVVYTVTAEDNTTQEYTVTVELENEAPIVDIREDDFTYVHYESGDNLNSSSILINADISDSDGTIETRLWEIISGQDDTQAFIPYKSAPHSEIEIYQEGVYELRFTVTDNDGATSYDTVIITVIFID